MKITAIILSHYKERQNNLPRIIEDLLSGTVKPDEIVVFIDNPEIEFEDDRVTIIRASKSFLPRIRFVLGMYFDSDYCFFIDDDLTVRSKTLENFAYHAIANPGAILGLEGSILGDTDNPYADDTPVNRGGKLIPVDIIIRTYFVPVSVLRFGVEIQQEYPELPQESLDDVYLCLGNLFINKGFNFVIPVDKDSDLTELDEAGVGQSRSGKHYENRNYVCRYLMEEYE